MLDKQSEKVLKYAISQYNGNIGNDIVICSNDVNLPYDTLNILCDNLYKNGYFNLCKLPYCKDIPVTITLTYKSLTYFECKKMEKHKYFIQLLSSKISDIIVSFVTAAITYIAMPYIVEFVSSLFNK